MAASKPIPKQGVSDRVEIFLGTGDGACYRVTLWNPHSKRIFKINDRVTFHQFQVSPYLGQCLSSKAFSRVDIEEESHNWTPNLAIVNIIKGGKAITTIDELANKITATNSAIGFLRADIVSYDYDIGYNGCPKCKKSTGTSTKCSTCPDSESVRLIRAVIYITDDNIKHSKLVLFEESVSCLLAIESGTAVQTDDGLKLILDRLQSSVGKQIIAKVRIQNRQFQAQDSEELTLPKTYRQITGMTPVFFFEGKSA